MDLNTKISLKDIDLKRIKRFFKKKETIIGICIFIFVCGIVFVGSRLIDGYLEAVDERETARKSYERITRLGTDVEKLNNRIEVASAENEMLLDKLVELDRKQVADLLENIKKETGIKWDDQNRSFLVKSEIKNVPGIKAISVNISKFEGKYEDIKNFLNYIKDYEREISVDAFTFSRDPLTGKMTGSMTLMFYMRNNEATQEDD